MGIKSIIHRGLRLASRIPLLRRLVFAYYDRRTGASGWSRGHPYDRENGLNTSGMLPGFVVRAGDALDAPTTAYVGSQPSIVRRALREIPHPAACVFLDLGCGKGRALAVASEFPFRAIKGVEFSAPLAKTSCSNARIIASAHPERTPIEVITSDALEYPLPECDLVIFLYHPFGRDLISRLLRAIESSLAAKPRALYVVYYNPVWAQVFDQSRMLARRYAEAIPYDASELGFGPDTDDSVVIWQDRKSRQEPPQARAARAVEIKIAGLRAEVVD
jgi:SAM-dependent methyltransferase